MSGSVPRNSSAPCAGSNIETLTSGLIKKSGADVVFYELQRLGRV
jgi:hypothetical protein